MYGNTEFLHFLPSFSDFKTSKNNSNVGSQTRHLLGQGQGRHPQSSVSDSDCSNCR